MYDPIIFDLDGTLLNTLGDLAAAGNYALSEMELPAHEEQQYRYFVGNGIPKLIERILPPDSEEADRQTAYRIFSEYYELHKSDRTEPYPGMTELLSELKSRGITAVCCTNKDHKFAAALLNGFFGENITETVGAGLGFAVKPDPSAALYLAKKYARSDTKPLYVGDSGVDMQTALNAHITACGVLWGFRDRKELEQYSPRCIAENVSELRRIILEKAE